MHVRQCEKAKINTKTARVYYLSVKRCPCASYLRNNEHMWGQFTRYFINNKSNKIQAFYNTNHPWHLMHCRFHTSINIVLYLWWVGLIKILYILYNINDNSCLWRRNNQERYDLYFYILFAFLLSLTVTFASNTSLLYTLLFYHKVIQDKYLS